MARRFGQMLLIVRLLRRARFGLASTRLRVTLLRIARLRVARLPALAVTRRLIAVSRTRRAWPSPEGCTRGGGGGCGTEWRSARWAQNAAGECED